MAGKKPMNSYEVTLPPGDMYQGRMPRLIHTKSAYSQEQSLTAVLKEFNCLHLAEDFTGRLHREEGVYVRMLSRGKEDPRQLSFNI